MIPRNPSTPAASKTCELSDLAALRRQLDEIERDRREDNTGKIRLQKIMAQCDALQNESREALTLTSQKQLHAHEHLHHVMKRTKEINEVMKALTDAESVDACFLVDCTNSMQQYIQEVKNSIFQTVKQLKSRFPHLNIRFAFVGYRDLDLPEDRQFSILDFTDERRFHAFVSQVHCEWGGDMCEDVLGGLQKVTELSWKQTVRILMHVGDCPSHGRRYHHLRDKADYYLSHDADGSIGYSCIQELIELGVRYFFGRLTPYTDKMIEEFTIFAENRMIIEQIDLRNFSNLLPFIVESISQSISSTQSSLLTKNSVNDETLLNENGASDTKCYRDVVFDQAEPIWDNRMAKRVQVIKYECNDQLHCKRIDQQWYVKIAENPFAEGGMRLAYYGLMQYKDKWEKVVLKEYKRIGAGANTKEKYLELLECQTIADYLAQEFNQLPQLVNRSRIVKRIKFIMTKLVFERLPGGKYRNLTMEQFIEGSYKKFSNNAGFVNYDDPTMTLQAFSHWTYQRTEGRMMVVDLQGIIVGNNQKYLLTDPCIHSTDLTRFGRSNLGKPGINRFFQTHVCNTICHILQLRPHHYQSSIKATKYDPYFVNKSNRTMFN